MRIHCMIGTCIGYQHKKRDFLTSLLMHLLHFSVNFQFNDVHVFTCILKLIRNTRIAISIGDSISMK